MSKPAKHKRGRPKSRRSGCLMCKPYKANGCKRPHVRDLKRAGLSTDRGIGRSMGGVIET